jgi:adenine/guanine phosphoribosyltransferase-like PRPP-binding protein
MVSELKVTIKDEEKKLDKKFLIYDTYTTDENDPMIKQCIYETLENFDGEPEKVIVTIKIEMQ